jgi:putative membrane protein
MNLSKLSCVTLVALGLAAGGCSKGSSNEAPGASQGSEATPAESSGLTDGQIAGILSTVDDGEIQQAQVALTKTNNTQVRNFADMMINEHQMSKQKTAQLLAQTKVNPAPSAPANKLKTNASEMLDKLNGADPNRFDQMYIEGQIEQHKQVLEMINDKLMPSAKDPMMQQQVSAAKSMVQHHLDMADKIEL